MTNNTLNINSAWTLFLDRDGVINERIMGGYVKSPTEFEFLPQVKEAITKLSAIFGRIVVVTNQQGIGKGLMTERNLLEVHTYMNDEIYKSGGKITKIYFAPQLAAENSELRKPNPGMGHMAKKEFPEIDFSRSVMVGDSDSDMLFGKNLGMKTVRVKTIEPIGVESDYTVDSLMEFANML